MKYWLYPKVKINSILSGRESFRRFTDVYYCSYLDVHWYGGKRDQSRHCRLDNIMYQFYEKRIFRNESDNAISKICTKKGISGSYIPSNALNRNIRPKSEHVFLNRNKVNIRHMQLFNWKLKPLPLLLNQYWLWEVFFLQIIQRLTELESKRIFRISRQFFVTETLRPAPWILVIAI